MSLPLGLYSDRAVGLESSFYKDTTCEEYVYRVPSAANSTLCSASDLSDNEQEYFLHTIDRFEKIYPTFIRSFIPSSKWNKIEKPITFVIISDVEMNDDNVFGKSDSITDGRYFPSIRIMYLRNASLLRVGPDLPHELAHVANAEIGITNREMDESLAYRFEKFYLEE